MEHRPFISVIIPVWNGARYLDACLNSILRQSWQHFEIIIVMTAAAMQRGIC